MKNTTVTMGLAALILAGTTNAQDITINWKVCSSAFPSTSCAVYDEPLIVPYLSKVASDGLAQNTAVIGETGKGLSAFENQLGLYQPLIKKQVKWQTTAPYLYGPTQQIGLAPSLAMANNAANYYDSAIEVHQGGQDSQSSLWFQLGSIAPPGTFPPGTPTSIDWGDGTQLGPGPTGPWTCIGCPPPSFDFGYNPTVAADNNLGPAGSSDPGPATIVEVHQSAAGTSTLYYHVGILTVGPSPSISWGPSLAVNSTTAGYAPTVSIANNVAVLVFQGSEGSEGNLWYSIGAVDSATSTIAWTTPVSYGAGYNPTVSVFVGGTAAPGQVLMEAHQAGNAPESLVYSVGVVNSSSPASITWSVTTSGTPDVNIPYATGCHPSVALAFTGTVVGASVIETHETACGSGSTEYLFGYLVKK